MNYLVSMLFPLRFPPLSSDSREILLNNSWEEKEQKAKWEAQNINFRNSFFFFSITSAPYMSKEETETHFLSALFLF